MVINCWCIKYKEYFFSNSKLDMNKLIQLNILFYKKHIISFKFLMLLLQLNHQTKDLIYLLRFLLSHHHNLSIYLLSL